MAARADLVPAQARRLPLRLHLAAGDAPPPSLRPAHALRLEGAPSGRDPQRSRDRDPGGFGMTIGLCTAVMRVPRAPLRVRGRRGQDESTAPEGTVLETVSGVGEGQLRRPGDGADEGRA